MQKKLFERPAVSLLPFLFLYVLLISTQYSDAPFGDEDRYIMFSQNLLQGFYSPPPPYINLWNGPGFPIYLVPFIAFGIPFLVIKLCNALLYYLALLVFFKTLSRFLDAGKSYLSTVVVGCYYMPFKSLPYILSEIFTILLISMVAYFAVKYFAPNGRTGNKMAAGLLAFLLAWLALTKVIFGPVYLAAFLLFLLLFVLTGNPLYKKSLLVLAGALLICSPYLVYTYNLTGKIFYWSNAGGMSMYWMSNPSEGEWGEWHNDSLTSPSLDERFLIQLQLNHQEDYAEIQKHTGVERDNKFKEFALQNLKENPQKVFINWLANWSRMFFNYPVSYIPLRLSTIGNMLANVPVLILLLFSAVLTWKRQSQFPFALKFLLILFGIYLLGSSLISAYDRMFYILTPVTGLWIAYSVFISRKEMINQKSK